MTGLPRAGTRAGARRRVLRGAPRSDERGSMAILMMVVLVGMMLSALLIPTIITQDRATRFDVTRVHALDAAQSGIDVTLGMLRASVTTSIGDSRKLPCGPVSGTVNSNSVAAYSVAVEYFTFDPVIEPYPSARAMNCVGGYGTFDTATGLTTPGFGRLTSTGTVGIPTNGSTAGRTLSATYVFRTSNVDLLGGIIAVAPAGAGQLCMDVGTPSAPAGHAVLLQPCSEVTPPAGQQVFAYRTDLTLQLLSSVTAANPNGLCLRPTHQPAVSGDAVQLFQCGVLGSPADFTQQWSYNDNGNYRAALSNSTTTGLLADLCMNVAVRAVNQAVVLGTCGSQWLPSRSVGQGAALLPQWSNYSEFGRCLDVPGQDLTAGFLINYPCQQNPFPGAKSWTQLFRAPAIPPDQSSVTGQIYTDNGQQQCLTSPGFNGGFVTVTTCLSGNVLQNWTIYDGDDALDHSTKYTVVNGLLCLGLGGPNARVPLWSTIDVETCAGSDEQKWNVNPNVLNTTLKNIVEK